MSWPHCAYGGVRARPGRDDRRAAGAGTPTPALAHLDIDKEGFAWLPEEDFVRHFAGDIDPVKARAMYAVQQALAASTLEDVMGVPAWKSQPSVEGGYLLAAGTALPPLVVDDEEAVALAVGLQAAAQGEVEGIAESSMRALAKVIQVMPARLRRRVEALGAMTVPASWGGGAQASVDPGILTTVALACRDSERLRFSYTAADGQHTDRHVEPHRMVLLGHRWHLVGYDLTRHDWRSFRVDRLTAPRGTAIPFRPRTLPAADAAAFVRAGMDNVFATYDVEVLVEAPAAAIRLRIGRWCTVEDVDDTHCRVRMTGDSLDWPVMALGMAGADFQVISPPELLDRAQDWARRFGRASLTRNDVG